MGKVVTIAEDDPTRRRFRRRSAGGWCITGPDLSACLDNASPGSVGGVFARREAGTRTASLRKEPAARKAFGCDPRRRYARRLGSLFGTEQWGDGIVE